MHDTVNSNPDGVINLTPNLSKFIFRQNKSKQKDKFVPVAAGGDCVGATTAAANSKHQNILVSSRS